MELIYALFSVIIVSLLSLSGALFLILKREHVEKFITYTLAFSSGVILGSVFFDLLPEAVDKLPETAFLFVLIGMIGSFCLEKLLQWHHHIEGDHHQDEEAKAVGYLSLIGDGIHNFIDGVVMAVAYLTSIPLGISTTIAVAAHELPHELADFIILLHAGFPSKKALFYNLLSACTAIAGTIFVFAVSSRFFDAVSWLLPVAAGNFLYIAASDLIPQLHKKRRLRTSIIQIIMLLAGVFIIALLPHE